MVSICVFLTKNRIGFEYFLQAVLCNATIDIQMATAIYLFFFFHILLVVRVRVFVRIYLNERKEDLYGTFI